MTVTVPGLHRACWAKTTQPLLCRDRAARQELRQSLPRDCVCVTGDGTQNTRSLSLILVTATRPCLKIKILIPVPQPSMVHRLQVCDSVPLWHQLCSHLRAQTPRVPVETDASDTTSRTLSLLKAVPSSRPGDSCLTQDSGQSPEGEQSGTGSLRHQTRKVCPIWRIHPSGLQLESRWAAEQRSARHGARGPPRSSLHAGFCFYSCCNGECTQAHAC